MTHIELSRNVKKGSPADTLDRALFVCCGTRRRLPFNPQLSRYAVYSTIELPLRSESTCCKSRGRDLNPQPTALVEELDPTISTISGNWSNSLSLLSCLYWLGYPTEMINGGRRICTSTVGRV